MQAPFVVLTGASGSGKTTIAHKIELEHPEITVFRFDTIGVPSAEVMATYGTGHQPGGAWLRAMTLDWFGKIAKVLASGRPVLFEGQMWIAFVLEALQVHGMEHARIICVECDDSTRTDRLTDDRLQPELANVRRRCTQTWLETAAHRGQPHGSRVLRAARVQSDPEDGGWCCWPAN